jgi:Calx-beta domain
MSTRHPPRVLSIAIMIALLLIAAQFSGGRAAAAGGTISITDVTHIEGNTGTTAFVFTISLSVADLADTTVTYTTQNGTAAGSDYTTTTGTATISANATSTTVTVLVKGDTSNEPNETFFVNLTNPSANATILDAQGLGTIANDDMKISIGNAIVTEDTAGPGAVFALTLSAPSLLDVTVNYATSNGSATAGLDYVAQSGTTTIQAGATNATITIPIIADIIDEDNETFNVNLTNPINAALANTKGVGTINDDDLPPTISIGDQSLLEGNTGATGIMPFTISLSAPSSRVVTVKYQTFDSTATAPADYTAVSLKTLTFPAGIQSQNVSVTVKGDTISEVNETFLVNLSVPVNATFAKSQGVGTINDDDPLPTISIGDITVAEPASGSATATFIVSLSSPSGQPVSMSYATADNSPAAGSATAGQDYQAQSGQIVFDPLLHETTKQITVLINSDQLVEPNETFFVNLTNPVGATFGDNQAIGTITSTAGVPTVSIAGATVTEGLNANAAFTVQLSSAATQSPITLNFVVSGVTAVAGSDFQAPATLSLVFQPNGATTQTILVPILDDILDENIESFNVTLTGATGATVGDGVASGTILDNDPAPSLTINNVKVSDAGSTPNAIFTLTLSTPSSKPISVDFQTANGSATAGQDYQAQAGTVHIPAGATSATIAIPIITDALAEPDQTFSVNLGNAVNATLATASGIGTISDQPQTAPGQKVYLPFTRR